MISFYLLWTGCYFVLLFFLQTKWPKTNPIVNSEDEFPSVTVIIPFRNELENLENLSEELRKLDYPKLKILLIDDQSEDGSFSFLQKRFQASDSVIILQSPGVGKKKALEFGVHSSASNLILCTDVDCTFPNDWLTQMVRPFADPKIQFVAGPVMSDGNTTFFQRFQQLEWSSILLVTQYFFSQKQPLMCSGANIAYRKSAFEVVKGYDQNSHHLSGDDEFLLKKISQHFGKGSCHYLPFAQNLVFTKAHNSFSELLNQRVRWAGKWKVHQDFSNAFSAVFSFFIQLIWLGSLILLNFEDWGIVTFYIVWMGKVLVEKFALGNVSKTLGMRFSFFDYMFTTILHPFYVIFVGLGSIRGKFTWKGRTN